MDLLNHGYSLGIKPSQLIQLGEGSSEQMLEMALNFIAQTPHMNNFVLEFAQKFMGASISTIEDYTALLRRFWPVSEGDHVNQFLRDTIAFNGSRTIYPEVRPMLVTGDGTALSVQAGYNYAASSSSLVGPFSDVEVASHFRPLPEVDTDDFGKNGDIYRHYPVDVLNGFIAEHGGYHAEYTRRVEAWAIQFSLDYDHHEGHFEGRELTFPEYLKERKQEIARISEQIAAGQF